MKKGILFLICVSALFSILCGVISYFAISAKEYAVLIFPAVFLAGSFFCAYGACSESIVAFKKKYRHSKDEIPEKDFLVVACLIENYKQCFKLCKHDGENLIDMHTGNKISKDTLIVFWKYLKDYEI